MKLSLESMPAKFSDRAIFLAFLALASSVTGVYFTPFLHNFFAYDDFGLLELVNQGPEAILLGYNYTLRFVNNAVWIPLYALFGYDPFGYNLFSMLLWLLNAVLLFAFLRRLLNNALLAALAGFIFAATAVGSDAVFWRAASGTLLNTTFYLLSLHAYTVFRQSGDANKWRVSVGCFILAMFSKEEAASLPLVVLLLEWLYFGGFSDIRGVVRRFLVFCSIIGFSVLLNYVVIYQVLHVQAELARMFKFRLLHSLFSGWTVFFLTPEGRLALNDPRIYVTAVLIPFSFLIVRDRSLLIFGLGWIFLTFLPQSLSGMSQFNPADVISVSLSRHLYLPSAGAACVVASLLASFAERFSVQIAVVATALFLALYLPYNYSMLKSRGEQWFEIGQPMKLFLIKIRKLVPQFPPNTRIFVINTPSGRAFIQQALRAFYRNQTITYIPDINNYQRGPGETGYLIRCHLEPDGDVGIRLSPLE
jgi:hypothetical protein